MTDELREQLRRADPAASLRPIAPEAVSRLLEDAMTTTNDSATRRQLPWLAAAAALVVLAAISVALLTGGEPERAPGSAALPTTTTDRPTEATGQPTATISKPTAATGQPTKGQPSVTRLSTSSDANSGKCRAPDAERLAATADLAIEGTVLGVNGNEATLQVKRTWTGARTELVQITQTDANTAALLAGVVLKPGETYLIASADGQVMICGFSGLANPELRALYDAAF